MKTGNVQKAIKIGELKPKKINTLFRLDTSVKHKAQKMAESINMPFLLLLIIICIILVITKNLPLNILRQS